MTTYKDAIRDRQQHERDLEHMAYGCYRRRFGDSVQKLNDMDEEQRRNRIGGIISGNYPLFMPVGWRRQENIAQGTSMLQQNRHILEEVCDP